MKDARVFDKLCYLGHEIHDGNVIDPPQRLHDRVPHVRHLAPQQRHQQLVEDRRRDHGRRRLVVRRPLHAGQALGAGAEHEVGRDTPDHGAGGGGDDPAGKGDVVLP